MSSGAAIASRGCGAMSSRGSGTFGSAGHMCDCGGPGSIEATVSCLATSDVDPVNRDAMQLDNSDNDDNDNYNDDASSVGDGDEDGTEGASVPLEEEEDIKLCIACLLWDVVRTYKDYGLGGFVWLLNASVKA
jgi:hypothetical protein